MTIFVDVWINVLFDLADSTMQVVRITWPDGVMKGMLQSCELYVKALKQHIPPQSVWMKIRLDLNKWNIKVDWKQIREKIRNLKRTYKKGNQSWKFHPLMKKLFTLPLEEQPDAPSESK